MLNRAFLKQTILTKLPTKAIRLLAPLEMATDIDGNILADVGDLRREKLMTPSLIAGALETLEKFGFISKKPDGTYFNNYHWIKDEKAKGFNYINLYNFFSNDDFKSLYKRALNFFYYIITSKLPGKGKGSYHTIAAEHLYQNECNKDKVVINYFQNFQDMVKHVSYFVASGYFEVQLGNLVYSNPGGENKEDYFKKFQSALYKYCGKDSSDQRKTRISQYKQLHILKIRVTASLLKDDMNTIYDRRTTLKDLESVALEYGYDLKEFDINQLKPIHQLKENLFNRFGKPGVEIYRKAISHYFQEQAHDFYEQILEGKFSDELKRVYIIPLIKLTLQSYFKNAAADILNQSSALSAIEKNSKEYVNYLTTEAYYDDVVLFEHESKKLHCDLYDHLVDSIQAWNEFKEKVKYIYQMEKLRGNSRTDVLYIARERMLNKKERQRNDEIKQVKLERDLAKVTSQQRNLQQFLRDWTYGSE